MTFFRGTFVQRLLCSRCFEGPTSWCHRTKIMEAHGRHFSHKSIVQFGSAILCKQNHWWQKYQNLQFIAEKKTFCFWRRHNDHPVLPFRHYSQNCPCKRQGRCEKLSSRTNGVMNDQACRKNCRASQRRLHHSETKPLVLGKLITGNPNVLLPLSQRNFWRTEVGQSGSHLSFGHFTMCTENVHSPAGD